MKKIIFNKIAPWVWTGCIVGIWSILLWNRIEYQLDSDMSSELILGNILSKEHGLLTDKWMYSTELRVLNTQLIYQIIFSFTNNWHAVRCISSILLFMILVVCYYYFMCQLGCKKSVWVLSPLLIGNYSEIYYHYVTKAPYYIPHICISFLNVGMLLQYSSSMKRSKKQILTFFMCILAILSGMGGPRQVIILYLPIMISSIVCYVIEIRNGMVQNKLQYMILCVVNFIFAAIGYLINFKVLSKKYQFAFWDIEYKDFSIESLITAFNGILRTFGYVGGKVFSFTTVLNICVFVVIMLTVISIYTGISGGRLGTSYLSKFLSVYFLSAIIIQTVLYTFTNMPYADRYYIPVLIFVIPIINIVIKEIRYDIKVKKIISISVLLLLYGCSFYKWRQWNKVDTTAQIREITNYLSDINVEKGYATFWNGNIMTELSNGKVEVWAASGAEELFKKDNINRWLQLSDHVENKPEGKIFVLLTQEEYNSFSQMMPPIQDVAFSNEGYILYIFDHFDDFWVTVEQNIE